MVTLVAFGYHFCESPGLIFSIRKLGTIVFSSTLLQGSARRFGKLLVLHIPQSLFWLIPPGRVSKYILALLLPSKTQETGGKGKEEGKCNYFHLTDEGENRGSECDWPLCISMMQLEQIPGYLPTSPQSFPRLDHTREAHEPTEVLTRVPVGYKMKHLLQNVNQCTTSFTEKVLLGDIYVSVYSYRSISTCIYLSRISVLSDNLVFILT